MFYMWFTRLSARKQSVLTGIALVALVLMISGTTLVFAAGGIHKAFPSSVIKFVSPDTFQLKIVFTGTGSGEVVIGVGDERATCSKTCSVLLPRDAHVWASGLSGTDSKLVGWSTKQFASICGANGCQANMRNEQEFTVTFDKR